MLKSLSANAAAILVALVVLALVVLALAHVDAPGVLEDLLLILTGGAAVGQIPRAPRGEA